MTAYTGKNLYLLWNGTSIESDYRVFEPSEEMGTVDISAGSDSGMTWATTLTDGSASLTMRSISGTAGTAVFITVFALATQGTLEWAPEGTATGNRRSYATALLTSRNEGLTYNDVSEWSIEWKLNQNAGVTHTTY